MEYILLEDCCEILDSMRIPITASSREKGIYPYYGANGIQDYVSSYIFDDDLVLLAEDGGSFGSKTKPIAYRVSGKCWVNNHAHVLKPKEGMDVDFLCYSLMFYNTEGLINGATRQKLTQSAMRKMKIPKLHIDIQRNIVKEIKSVKSIIEISGKQLEKLSLLVRARFVEMFGEGLKDDGKFKLKPISKIGQVVSGATPKTSRHEYWNGDNVWITPAELSDESFVIYNSERKLSYEGVDSCAVNLLPVGTVILSSRAPIGKVAIAGVEMYCNQGFKNIIPRDEISSIYLYELLKMETEYLNSLGRGATFKEISKQIVENIRVKVPPIELQNEFATFVEQVNKSKLLAASQPQIHIYKTLTLL